MTALHLRLHFPLLRLWFEPRICRHDVPTRAVESFCILTPSRMDTGFNVTPAPSPRLSFSHTACKTPPPTHTHTLSCQSGHKWKQNAQRGSSHFLSFLWRFSHLVRGMCQNGKSVPARAPWSRPSDAGGGRGEIKALTRNFSLKVYKKRRWSAWVHRWGGALSRGGHSVRVQANRDMQLHRLVGLTEL